MDSSIQEKLKKINSAITFADIVSLLLTALVLGLLCLYLYQKERDSYVPVTYEKSSSRSTVEVPGVTRPFASKNGTTYTFSWCQGATMIKEANRIYFSSEEEAQASGRKMSLLCKK